MSNPSMPSSINNINKSPNLQPQTVVPPHQVMPQPLIPIHPTPILIPGPNFQAQPPTTTQIIRSKLLNKGTPSSPIMFPQAPVSPTLMPAYYSQQPNPQTIPPSPTSAYQLMGYESYRRPDGTYSPVPYQPELYQYGYPGVYYQPYPVYYGNPRLYPDMPPYGAPSFRDITDSPLSFTDVKLKPANFSASKLVIGEWEVNGTFQADIIAKFYFTKKQIVWELLKVSVKSKIVICFADITALVIENINDETTSLTVEISKRPKFYKEINPQPKKNTMWGSTEDFSPNSQASIYRRHTLHFKKSSLQKNLDKLQQSDQKLRQLLIFNQFTTDDLYLPGENPQSQAEYYRSSTSNGSNSSSTPTTSETSSGSNTVPHSPVSSSPYSNPSSDFGSTNNSNGTPQLFSNDDLEKNITTTTTTTTTTNTSSSNNTNNHTVINNTQQNTIPFSYYQPQQPSPIPYAHPVYPNTMGFIPAVAGQNNLIPQPYIQMVQVSQQLPPQSTNTTPMSNTPTGILSSIEIANENKSNKCTTTTTTTTTTAANSNQSTVESLNSIVDHINSLNQFSNNQETTPQQQFYNFSATNSSNQQVPFYSYQQPQTPSTSITTTTSTSALEEINNLHSTLINQQQQIQQQFSNSILSTTTTSSSNLSLLPSNVNNFINQPTELSPHHQSTLPKSNNSHLISSHRHHPYSNSSSNSSNTSTSFEEK